MRCSFCVHGLRLPAAARSSVVRAIDRRLTSVRTTMRPPTKNLRSTTTWPWSTSAKLWFPPAWICAVPDGLSSFDTCWILLRAPRNPSSPGRLAWSVPSSSIFLRPPKLPAASRQLVAPPRTRSRTGGYAGGRSGNTQHLSSKSPSPNQLPLFSEYFLPMTSYVHPGGPSIQCCQNLSNGRVIAYENLYA